MPQTILIVEDNELNMKLFHDLLAAQGYRVLQTEDGMTALETARRDPPDLILMDVVMPELNGFQATRMLSKDPATASIPIIVISSKNQESDRMWAMRQGAREYIIKPVKEADLLGKIKLGLGG